MKKNVLAITLVCVLVMALGLLVGCGPKTQAEVRAAEEVILDGSPANIPATHGDRFERLGSQGCYGCHGANETANPMLTGAVPMPIDHYTGADVTSFSIDPVHGQCITCHAQDK